MKQGPKAGVLGQPSGIGWEGRWEKGSGWGGEGGTCIPMTNSCSDQSLSRVQLFATP